MNDTYIQKLEEHINILESIIQLEWTKGYNHIISKYDYTDKVMLIDAGYFWVTETLEQLEFNVTNNIRCSLMRICMETKKHILTATSTHNEYIKDANGNPIITFEYKWLIGNCQNGYIDLIHYKDYYFCGPLTPLPHLVKL